MGILLSKPIIGKIILNDKNKDLIYGYCSMQGWRIEMEDAHYFKLNMDKPFDKWSFFGIFDGHNGEYVALRCRSSLLSTILKTPEFEYMKLDKFGNPLNIEQLRIGIRRGFINFDSYLCTLPEIFTHSDQSGSTAICAFITPKYIIFINCGDSRGILIRNSICYFSTQDHKPSDPQEYARIIKAGGTVISNRVNGCLALSRSLGDFTYKKSEKKSPFEQLVSADPTITIFEKTDDDQMIVLCCDGIWDVIKNDELCDFLLSRVIRIKDLGKIAEEVVNLCFYKGSKDNISAVVVLLKGNFDIDEELALEDMVLNKRIKEIVNEFCQDNPNATASTLVRWLRTIDLPNLPPGGVFAKQSIIEEEFYNIKDFEKSNFVETPKMLRKRNVDEILKDNSFI